MKSDRTLENCEDIGRRAATNVEKHKLLFQHSQTVAETFRVSRASGLAYDQTPPHTQNNFDQATPEYKQRARQAKLPTDTLGAGDEARLRRADWISRIATPKRAASEDNVSRSAAAFLSLVGDVLLNAKVVDVVRETSPCPECAHSRFNTRLCVTGKKRHTTKCSLKVRWKGTNQMRESNRNSANTMARALPKR